MACPSWMDRGFALGTVFGVLVGGGAVVAWFVTRPKPADNTTADDGVITISKADMKRLQEEGIQRYLAEAMKSKARLHAKMLSTAIEAYVVNPANAESTLPASLNDLSQPLFGGVSFLKRGAEDLLDPWGKPFQMHRRIHPDGSEYAIVSTTAPDGTPISQFGIGDAAKPKE